MGPVKAAYCLAVCPAGEDVIGPFLDDRAQHVSDIVKPLQRKEEPLYVVPGSDAEAYAARRFPHKPLRRVAGSLRPQSISGFLAGMSLAFQRDVALKEELDATYHMVFSGSESAEATVVIRAGQLRVKRGLAGDADLTLRADADTWLGFLAKERGIVWALMRGKIRVSGPIALLKAFGRCFPS